MQTNLKSCKLQSDNPRSSLHPFLVVKTTLWEVDKQHNLKQNKEEDLLGSTVCNATLLRDINSKPILP